MTNQFKKRMAGFVCVAFLGFMSCDDIDINELPQSDIKADAKIEARSGWTVIQSAPSMKSNYTDLDGLVNDPWVMKVGGDYVMYYGAMKGDFSDERVRVFRAVSKDGLNWQRDKKPVIPLGSKGQWDSAKIETPSVVKGPDDIYRMYYSGNNKIDSEMFDIGLATSQDGKKWTKYSASKDKESTPVLKAGSKSFDGLSALEPSVLYKDGRYWMWYVGISRQYIASIGLAKSEDGINWTSEGQVLKMESSKEQKNRNDAGLTEVHVIWNGQKFEMFYVLLQNEGKLLGPIWHAVSKDGKEWIKDDQPFLVAGGRDTWTGQGIQSPSVLIEDNEYKMWFGGTHTDGKSYLNLGIGLATKKN